MNERLRMNAIRGCAALRRGIAQRSRGSVASADVSPILPPQTDNRGGGPAPPVARRGRPASLISHGRGLESCAEHRASAPVKFERLRARDVVDEGSAD